MKKETKDKMDWYWMLTILVAFTICAVIFSALKSVWIFFKKNRED